MTTPDAARMEKVLGRVLGVGLAISIVVLLVGLPLTLAGAAPAAADRILRVGLMILMATPVARVATAAIEYAMERDWAFLAITLSVLAVLFGSLLAALRVS
jgi:uncharacterized membrane protein